MQWLIAILWPTYLVWLTVGLVLGSALWWIVALAAYVVMTLLLARALWVNVRAYRCTDCGLRWRN